MAKKLILSTNPMLGTHSVIGFIPTQDFGRAQAFYENTLGLRLTATDGFALVLQAPAQ